MNWNQYILLELYGTNWLASKKCFLSSQGPASGSWYGNIERWSLKTGVCLILV